MITIHPFRALMPAPAVADDVAAVPYDVVDRDEAAALAADNPLSFLRVSRAEVELPADTDPYAPEVYELAATNLARLTEAAPLCPDAQPTLYVYSLVMDGHRQTGLVAAAAVDDYDDDRIRKHEKTRPTKEDDRTRHTLALRAHTGPVFLTARDTIGFGAVLDDIRAANQPLFDVTAADDVQHQVWRVPAPQAEDLVAAFRELEALYVADGHHRAKCASRVRAELRAANADHTGDEAYNRFLVVVFPGDQLQILAYNRVVHDLNGHSAASLLAAVGEAFDVAPAATGEPAAPGCFHMYLAGAWHALTPRQAVAQDAVGALDVSVLQERILAPLLGVDDPRTSERISFVGGIHGTSRLESLVDDGRAAVAFSMVPVTVSQLMAISDAGEIMPPKSTWFEPKLRDGLLSHTF
jgi:uncharacterized protein (DUF1015 family)